MTKPFDYDHLQIYSVGGFLRNSKALHAVIHQDYFNDSESAAQKRAQHKLDFDKIMYADYMTANLVMVTSRQVLLFKNMR